MLSMDNNRYVSGLLFACLVLFYAASIFGQGGTSPAKLTEGEILETVENLASMLEENYVFPEKGKTIADFIRSQHKEGKYSSIDNVPGLCDAVTADLRTASGDVHLALVQSQVGGPHAPQEKTAAAKKKKTPQRRVMPGFGKEYNYGFRKFENLEGNIAYLDLRGFDDVRNQEIRKTAESVMALLANTEAVIIDLRWNPGGTGGMAHLLASYFFGAEPVHLLSNTSRFKGKEYNREHWTLKEVNGTRMQDKPLYLLISGRTGSAAEHFTFSLSCQDRAVLIGETTSGAGHNVAFIPLNQYFNAKISIGRTYDPRTGKGWEGTGIPPHIEVSVDKALETAHMEALKRMIAEEKDEEKKARLEWQLPFVRAQYNPVLPDNEKMRDFAGQYGVYEFVVENESLFLIRRGRRGKIRLATLPDGGFFIPGMDNTIFKFFSSEEKGVPELHVLHQSGVVQKIIRNQKNGM
jgi:C-terminal processing protease CtpA/Prc